MVKILEELKKKANKKKAKDLAWFFKTGKGEYGEGDLFLGITVPEIRKTVKKFPDTPLGEIEKLLKNKYHEIRLTALLLLVDQYQISTSPSARKVLAEKIFNFYLKNTKYINNWDLVDLSAPKIVGDYLYSHHLAPTNGRNTPPWQGEKKILEKLAKSKNMWERRIAIVSTFAFIYKGNDKQTYKIVKMLINDKNDLIHKACGWMLREAGKRVSESHLEAFLSVYGPKIPRTMLRYAIERLPDSKRRYYLNK